MPDYRLFVLDELGHIHEPAQVLTCVDTRRPSLTLAKVDGHPVELWLGARRVADIAPKKAGRSGPKR